MSPTSQTNIIKLLYFIHLIRYMSNSKLLQVLYRGHIFNWIAYRSGMSTKTSKITQENMIWHIINSLLLSCHCVISSNIYFVLVCQVYDLHIFIMFIFYNFWMSFIWSVVLLINGLELFSYSVNYIYLIYKGYLLSVDMTSRFLLVLIYYVWHTFQFTLIDY